MMKNVFRTGLFLLLLLGAGCSKEKFPDEFVILGTWIEKADVQQRMEIDFRSSNRAFLNKGGNIDTLMYRIDKKDELLLFRPQDFPDGQRTIHKLTYNRRKEELSIYNLIITHGEPSVSVFVRK